MWCLNLHKVKLWFTLGYFRFVMLKSQSHLSQLLRKLYIHLSGVSATIILQLCSASTLLCFQYLYFAHLVDSEVSEWTVRVSVGLGDYLQNEQSGFLHHNINFLSYYFIEFLCFKGTLFLLIVV